MTDLEALGWLYAATFGQPERGCEGCVIEDAATHIEEKCIPCLLQDMRRRYTKMCDEDFGKAEIDTMKAWLL